MTSATFVQRAARVSSALEPAFEQARRRSFGGDFAFERPKNKQLGQFGTRFLRFSTRRSVLVEKRFEGRVGKKEVNVDEDGIFCALDSFWGTQIVFGVEDI